MNDAVPPASEHSSRSGILLVDKPGGITSHGVVSRVRRLAGTRKVGHAGTLDPMATGLLVLGINSSTRLLTFLVGLDKTYEATIRLGASTSTDDREGEITSTADASAVADEAVELGLTVLRGEIDQVPSTVSAIKVDGRRAYALARAGESVELKSRRVTITEFVVLARRDEGAFVDLDVRVTCSSGTYIRALARDLGSGLAVGGHLTALRRTRIGPFRVADAVELEHLDVPSVLVHPATAAGALFASVVLDADQARDLTHGKKLELPDVPDGSPISAVGPDGRLVGLIGVRNGVGRSVVGFPADEVAP